MLTLAEGNRLRLASHERGCEWDWRRTVCCSRTLWSGRRVGSSSLLHGSRLPRRCMIWLCTDLIIRVSYLLFCCAIRVKRPVKVLCFSASTHTSDDSGLHQELGVGGVVFFSAGLAYVYGPIGLNCELKRLILYRGLYVTC